MKNQSMEDKNLKTDKPKETGILSHLVNILLWVIFFYLAANIVPIYLIIIGVTGVVIYYFMKSGSAPNDISESTDIDLPKDELH